MNDYRFDVFRCLDQSLFVDYLSNDNAAKSRDHKRFVFMSSRGRRRCWWNEIRFIVEIEHDAGEAEELWRWKSSCFLQLSMLQKIFVYSWNLQRVPADWNWLVALQQRKQRSLSSPHSIRELRVNLSFSKARKCLLNHERSVIRSHQQQRRTQSVTEPSQLQFYLVAGNLLSLQLNAN